MPFSKLIGNDLAKTALQRMAVLKSVPNTLLFHGPDGVGKSRFALALTQLLMGEEHASKLISMNHPDLHIFRPEGKSAVHTIESIRQIIDEVALPPYEAKVKVFIIHDAHQMLPYSSNALLKTLEEPSLHSHFVLLTPSLDSMLATIISRCRKVAFFPIPQAQMEIFIQENWQKTPEEARRLAFLAHGSLAKAESIAHSRQAEWRANLIELLSLYAFDEYPQLLSLSAQIEEACEREESESIFTQADAIFEEIVAWYRDLHLIKEGIALEYLYHLDHIDRLKSVVLRPIPALEKIFDQISKSRLALHRSVKLRTVLEHFLLNLN